MRGNSGFLRWLPSFNSIIISNTNRGRLHDISIIAIILLSITTATYAGPVSIRNRRMIREVYSELEVIKSQNSTEPDAGICLFNGSQVSENSIDCEKKTGCRAIQKTGYCCPDYQCDCERDGKLYVNGDKLVEPETPCRVCHCQGGEITCSSVTCYIRNDCEPKFIPGRCCPEYDNCPPLASDFVENLNQSINKAETTPSEIQSTIEPISDQVSSPSSTVLKQETIAVDTSYNANNPLGIKIKEITKPEEIRIIDEKPKQTYQIIKPFSTSNGSNPPKMYSVSKEDHPFNIIDNNQSDNVVQTSSNNEMELIQNKETNNNNNNNNNNSISEMINKLENTDVNSVNDEDSLKIVRHTNLSDKLPEEPDSDDDSVQAAPLAENVNSKSEKDCGEKVVIVDRNGQTKPITVFGIQGLQRGDIPDEIVDYDDRKIPIKRIDSKLTDTKVTQDENHGSELIYGQSIDNDLDNKTYIDLDQIASGSSNEYVRVIMSTEEPIDTNRESTTEGLDNLLLSTSGKIYDTVFYTSGPDSSLTPDEEIFDTFYYSEQQDNLNGTTESNPGYPSIHDDDLSIYRREASTASFADDEIDGKLLPLPSLASLKQDENNYNEDDGKILADILIFKNNSSTTEGPDKNDSSVSLDWLKNDSSTTEGLNIDDLIDNQIIGKRAPGEPFLIPEWERNSTDSTNDTTIELSSSELDRSIEIDMGSGGSGSGSGFGQSPILETDNVEASSEIFDSTSNEPEKSFEYQRVGMFQRGIKDFLNFNFDKIKKSFIF